jgi:hypothetical protein
MSDILRAIEQRSLAFRPTPEAWDRVLERAARRKRNRRIGSAILALSLFAGGDAALLTILRSTPRNVTPADRKGVTPSIDGDFSHYGSVNPGNGVGNGESGSMQGGGGVRFNRVDGRNLARNTGSMSDSGMSGRAGQRSDSRRGAFARPPFNSGLDGPIRHRHHRVVFCDGGATVLRSFRCGSPPPGGARGGIRFRAGAPGRLPQGSTSSSHARVAASTSPSCTTTPCPITGSGAKWFRAAPWGMLPAP